MDRNNSLMEAMENGANNNVEKSDADEIIELDGSESDIEILSVSPNIASRKKRKYFKSISKRQASVRYTNSVNNSLRNGQESYIKEEIMLSEGSDCSDNECQNGLNGRSRIHPNASPNFMPSINKRRNRQNQSLSSITLNCPKCNKTDKVFTVTIKTCCKECKINMTYVCNDCNNKYDSLPALFRHKKIQCKAISYLGNRCLTPKHLFIFKCVKCSQNQPIGKLKDRPKCKTCNLRMMIECKVCSKTYTINSGLWLHAKNQCQSEANYYCNDCNFKCNSENKFLRHFYNKHADLYPMNIDCDRCGKNYADPFRLSLHKVSCGKPKYKCKFCPYKPKHLKNLKKHVLENHADKEEVQKVENVSTTTETKNQSDKSTESQMQQLIIIDDNESEDYLSSIRRTYCPNCNVCYDILQNQRDCEQCSNPCSFKCLACSKLFNSYMSLYRHTRRCHGEKHYKCNKCGKLSAFMSDAKDHERYCVRKPEHKCELCEFVTKYRHNLEAHTKRMHDRNRKQYVCQFCGVKYVTFRSIKKHMLIHKRDNHELISNNSFFEEQIFT